MLLDKFLLLFETDADSAKKELDGLNDTLDDTEESAAAASLSIADLIKGVISLAAIKATVLDTAFRVDTIGKFSETLGFSVEQVDAWGAAVERSGGSTESFMGSISSLNDQLTDLALDGGSAAAETLARLGISATDAQGNLKGVFDLLPELADSFQRMSREESFGFGKRLGLDQGTILLLQQGRVAVADLVEQQRLLGGMTEESYKASAEFNDEVDNTGRVFDAVWQTANTTILPMLSSLLRGIQSVIQWMREHKEFMIGFFSAAAVVITATLIPAFSALALAIKANPLFRLAVLAAGVGTAFALLYEDVKAYSEGHSSLIGDLAEKYEWFGKVVDVVLAAINERWEGFQARLDWVKLLVDDPRAALIQLKDEFLNLWNYIKDLFDFSSLLDGLPTWLGGKGDLAANTQAGMNTQQLYANNPVNAIPSGMMFNTSQIQRSINVSMGNISVDARGMSQDQARGLINDEFSRQLANAAGQLDDGVDR